jgi:hypothetical protein
VRTIGAATLRAGRLKPLTGEAIALILKEIAEACGYDPAQIAGHSLRAGFATTAANRGKSLHNIMRASQQDVQGTKGNERCRTSCPPICVHRTAVSPVLREPRTI